MLALPLVWLGCAIAAIVYAGQQHIPWHLTLLALPAFLLEATFYFALGQEKWRARLERLSPALVALALTAAAAAPYCAASLAFGTFGWRALAVIAGLAAVASFWYVVLPRNAGTDILFLILMTAVFVANLAPHQYVNPHPKLRLDALGRVMWIRTGAFAMISVRRVRVLAGEAGMDDRSGLLRAFSSGCRGGCVGDRIHQTALADAGMGSS